MMRCSNSWLAPRIEREKLDAYVKEDPYVVNGLVRVPEHIFLMEKPKLFLWEWIWGMFLGPGPLISTRFPPRFPCN